MEIVGTFPSISKQAREENSVLMSAWGAWQLFPVIAANIEEWRLWWFSFSNINSWSFAETKSLFFCTTEETPLKAKDANWSASLNVCTASTWHVVTTKRWLFAFRRTDSRCRIDSAVVKRYKYFVVAFTLRRSARVWRDIAIPSWSVFITIRGENGSPFPSIRFVFCCIYLDQYQYRLLTNVNLRIHVDRNERDIARLHLCHLIVNAMEMNDVHSSAWHTYRVRIDHWK